LRYSSNARIRKRLEDAMALVGLKRASELTGKNQSTIHRAMKAGRLSYSLSDSGERLLDTSELTRLFPLKSDDDGLRNDASAEQRNYTQAADLRERLAFMQQRIDALEADKIDLRAERDRLLSVIETQAQQVKLLTDQRPAARSRWWGRMFSGR
jgi:hypothetical protein